MTGDGFEKLQVLVKSAEQLVNAPSQADALFLQVSRTRSVQEKDSTLLELA